MKIRDTHSDIGVLALIVGLQLGRISDHLLADKVLENFKSSLKIRNLIHVFI